MLLQLSDKNTETTKGTDGPDKEVILIAKLIALCLVGGFFAFFYLRSQVIQEISFLALAVPAFLQVRYGLADIQAAKKSYVFSLVYLIPVFLSFVINMMLWDKGSVFDIVVIINLYFAFYIASIFASGEKHGLWREILKYVFILSAPLFVYVFITQSHAYVWGRWQPFDLQPNWWGMMALGAAWGATSLKDIKLRLAAIAAVFLFMVELQSRGSIVALMPVFLFSSGLFLPLTSKKFVLLIFAAMALLFGALLTAFIFEKGVIEHLFDYVSNQVFMLHDTNRGIGTGLTGRTEGYAKAWEGFVSSPIFGGGFGEYGFVHNGFLLTLAETGLLGFIGMMMIIGRIFFAIMKKKDWVQLGLFLSYIAALMTFPRSFNINMTGFIFILVLMQNIQPIKLGKKNRRPLITQKFVDHDE